jgi:hypothetical protein
MTGVMHKCSHGQLTRCAHGAKWTPILLTACIPDLRRDVEFILWRVHTEGQFFSRGDTALRTHVSVLALSSSGKHVAVRSIVASPSVGFRPAPVIIKTDDFRKALDGSGCDPETMIVRPIPEEGRTVCLDVSNAAYDLLTNPSLD